MPRAVRQFSRMEYWFWLLPLDKRITKSTGVGEPNTRERNSGIKYDMLALSLRRFGTLGGKSLKPDPFVAFRSQLEDVRSDILRLVEWDPPILSEAAKYYFQQQSKQMRPLFVLLMAQATNGLGEDWQLKLWESTHPGAGGREDELDIPFSPPEIFSGYNNARFRDLSFVLNGTSRARKVTPIHNRESPPKFPPSSHTLHSPMTILPKQKRLAVISEIVHTASLIHDDVIDKSTLRRGVPSASSKFSCTLCVLVGHFLIGLSSALTVQLRDLEVARVMSGILTNLIEGEILQMKDLSKEDEGDVMVKSDGTKRCEEHRHLWIHYLQKSFLKTAAPLARAARATVILGGCGQGQIWREIAYGYGRNFGIAFQIEDDLKDIEARTDDLGKPVNADLRLGLATAPALYAWEEYPEMGELIKRKFQFSGDVEQAQDLIHRSSAILRTRQLAQSYADEAKNIIRKLPDSDARDQLEQLADYVVRRDR